MDIKSLRLAKGYTQQELAEKLGVRQQTLSLWENGKTQPNKKIQEKIQELFNINSDNSDEIGNIVREIDSNIILQNSQDNIKNVSELFSTNTITELSSSISYLLEQLLLFQENSISGMFRSVYNQDTALYRVSSILDSISDFLSTCKGTYSVLDEKNIDYLKIEYENLNQRITDFIGYILNYMLRISSAREESEDEKAHQEYYSKLLEFIRSLSQDNSTLRKAVEKTISEQTDTE